MGDKLRGGTTIGGNIAYHAGNIPTWNQDTTGNAGTSTKLATARTIALSGDVGGSTSFDGSGNVSITTTVVDDSHNHTFANLTSTPATATRWPTFAEVSGKPTTFTPSAHTHPWAQVTGAPVTATRWPTFAEVAGKPIVQVTGASTTDLMSQKAVTDAINAGDSTAVKLTGNQTIAGVKTFSSTITGNITGNAGTATKLSTTRANFKGITDSVVVGELMWKNFGNSHTIFDASNSTTPTGVAKNNTNPEIAWSATYPTLMGYNGNQTYGVRVDSSRYADQLKTAITINGVSFNGSANIIVSDSTAVNLTGNQTVEGVKTFNSSPIVPTPTTGTQAVNKSYADLKVALADFTGANQNTAGSGYQKLPGGLIIQWGANVVTTSGSTGQTFPLPISFPNAFLRSIAGSGASGGTSATSCGSSGESNSLIRLYSTSTTLTLRWVAIGY